jgi:hypothetical protein
MKKNVRNTSVHTIIISDIYVFSNLNREKHQEFLHQCKSAKFCYILLLLLIFYRSFLFLM